MRVQSAPEATPHIPEASRRSGARPPDPPPSLLREVGGVFTSRIGMILAVFITGILLSRFLGPEGRGVLASLLVYPELVLTLVGGGVWQAAVYQLGQGEHREEAVVAAVTGYMAGLSILGIAVCAAIFEVLDNPAFTPWLVIGALAMIPFKTISTFSGGVLLGMQDAPGYNRTRWLLPVVRLVGVLALVVAAGWQVGGAVVATVAASVVTAVVGMVGMYRRTPLRSAFERVVVKQQFTLGAVYAASLFVRTLNYRADVVVLERMVPATQVGLYTQGVSLAELLWLLPTSLGLVIFSRSAHAKGSPAFTTQVARLLRVTLIVATLGSIALAAVAGVVVPLVYGQDFAPSATIIRLLLPGVVAFVVIKVCSMDLAGRGKPQIALYVVGPAVLVNIALNLWWIPLWGINGAAIASTVSYLGSAVVYLIVYARLLDLSMSTLLRPHRNDFDFLKRLHVGLLR